MRWLPLGVPASPLGGTPADTILEVARRSSCDLIVMGTHGRRGLSHVLAGSVTESVLRRGTVPVLAVRRPAYSPGAHGASSRSL